MGKSKNKIFFGTVDVGWRIECYQQFIKTKFFGSITSFSLVYYKAHNSLYRTHYDRSINIMGKNRFIKLISKTIYFPLNIIRHNTFHFISGETLSNRAFRVLEFKLLKALNKKVIMHFVGSDIRNPNWLIDKNESLIQKNDLHSSKSKQLPWQVKLCEDSEKYADTILVSTPDLLELIPSATYFPVMLDITKIEKEHFNKGAKKGSKIKILHAPSNPEIKGSKFIDGVMAEIKAVFGDQIEYINTSHKRTIDAKLHSISRNDLFNHFSETDIVIDQMVIGWYGLQSVEALYFGCSVISYIDEKLLHHRFPNCPIISTTPNLLKDVLIKEIHNKLDTQKIKPSNNSWVLKHHTIENNNRDLVKAWTN